MIALTETWLPEEILDSELFPPDFVVFKKTRYPVSTGASRCGGVLLAFRNSLTCAQINLSCLNKNFPNIDIVGVKIFTINGKKLLVFVIYVPSETSGVELTQHDYALVIYWRFQYTWFQFT